ncbi:MAG: toxin TcdB middle/N-terminal domain-containing protein [Candidatus Manganitrophaceae bacterium]
MKRCRDIKSFFSLLGLLLLFSWMDCPAEAFVIQNESDADTQTAAAKVEAFQTNLFTGSASTSIPIMVPPGTAGVQPSLALSYNSASRNEDVSLIGAGWDLTGLGYIERSTKNGAPKYDNSDTYVLVINGASHDLVRRPDGYYHTKDETFLLTFYRIAPEDFWTITDKNGVQYRFGYNADSKSAATDRNGTRRWSLDEIQDTHANQMLITYTNDNGAVYPSSITYTVKAGISAYRTVGFNYESRPDQLTNYRYGAPITIAKRLSYIDVKMNGNMVRRYQLTYTDSTDSKESLLVQVKEYGADADPTIVGTGTSHPPMIFSYQAGQNLFGGDESGLWGNQASDNDGGWFGDFNGDGRTDLLFCSGGVLYVLKSHGTNFLPRENWLTQSCDTDSATTGNQLSIGTHDFDGDGKEDIDLWNQNTNQLTLYQSTGSSFTLLATWTPPVGAVAGFFGDVNGDGKTDLIYTAYFSNCSNLGIFGGCTAWQVQLATGNGFGSAATWYAYGSPIAHLWASVLDLDGNGKSDLLLELQDTSVNPPSKALYAGLSSGNNFSGPNSGYWLSPPPTEPKANWRLGDFNGDGLPDLMVLVLTDTNQNGDMDQLEARIYPSKGYLFDTSAVWLTQGGIDWYLSFINSGDFNGDGKTDLWSYHALPTPHWQVNLSSGNNLSAPGSGDWGAAAPGNYGSLFEDFDGDGKMDRGEYWAGTYDLDIFPSAGPPVDLLKTSQNGLGGKSIQLYTSTGHADTCATNPNYLPFKVQVVCAVTQDDGMGKQFTTTYSYQGAKFDPLSREFRGFNQVKVTDPTGAYSKTTFLQTSELKGKPSEVESFGPDNELYTRTLNTWDFTPIPNVSGVNFSSLKQEDVYIFDTAVTAKQTQTQYKYDCYVSNINCYGNVIEVHRLGDLDNPWDDRHDFIEYFPNTTARILSRPGHTYTLNSSNTKIAESFNHYDGANLPAQYNVPPVKGDLTRVCKWLNSGTNSCTTFLYDAYGNRTRTTDANNNLTIVAYDLSYRTFPLTQTNPRNQVVTKTYWGIDTALTPVAGSYAVPGMLATVTDPNNVRTDNYWDALGRPFATVVPPDTAAAPTSVTTYNQSGTAPSHTLVQKRKSPTGGTLDIYTFVDGLGRTIQTKTPASDGTNQIVSDTTYNSRGLTETGSIPYLKPATSTYSSPDTTVKKTTTLYDPLRRVTQVTNTDGTYSSVLYNKWTTTAIDPNGHKKVQVRDALGRLIQVEEYTGADGRNAPTYPAISYTLYATTSYDYDGFDASGNNIQTIVDALGNKTTVIFDTLGRKIFMDDPDMGDWKYSYDPVGNLLKQGDAKKQIISFAYDNLNRVISKTTSLDNTVPNTPSNLSATAYSNTQINLSWTAPTDNFGISGYWIERCQGANCDSTPSNFARITSSFVTTASYSNAGLTSNTSYSYRVQAVDLAGNLGGYSTVATVLTKADPVLTLTKSGTGSGSITSNPVGLDCGATCTPSFALSTSVALTATSSVGSTFTGWSGACTGTGACNVTMDAAKSVTATFNDNQPPTAPDVLTATASSDTQIVLLWTVSSDNMGVDHYVVERSPNKTSYSSIGSPTVNQLTNSASSGVTYLYRVRAVDAAGNASAYSSVDLATAIVFADDPIVAQSTVVKADHFIKLRDAVNAVRTAAALPTFNWSTTAPTQGDPVNPVKAQHIIDLRNNLIPGLNLLGLPIPSYTDPALTTGAGGTLIKKDHIQQLRQGVK